MTQASQVDAESELEGLCVRPFIRNTHEPHYLTLLDFWFERPDRL